MTKHTAVNIAGEIFYLIDSTTMARCDDCYASSSQHVVRHARGCRWAADHAQTRNVFVIANDFQGITAVKPDGTVSLPAADIRTMATHILSTKQNTQQDTKHPKFVVRVANTDPPNVMLFIDGINQAIMVNHHAVKAEAEKHAQELKAQLGLLSRYEVTTTIPNKDPMVNIIEAEDTLDVIKILSNQINANVSDIRIKKL